MTDYRDLRDIEFCEQQLRDRHGLEEQAAEWARAKRQRQREEQRPRRNEIDELRREIEALRADIAARHEGVGQALGAIRGQAIDHARDAVKEVENRLLGVVERRFGELLGRLDALEPQERRAKDFKFANEKVDAGPIDSSAPCVGAGRSTDDRWRQGWRGLSAR
jgi:DNA repair exonuclease SbcCD ATPase subunit